MATLLLFVIYIAFIGLGVPDSLFGTAWPAIYPEFDLPVSAASVVTLLISGCTVVSSLLSARIINRLGTAAVTAASTTLTAAALLGFSLSGNLPWLCLFALPLGVGPVFPNLIHLTPANFGRDISQSVMGTQMAATYMGIMLMPPVFGFLAQAAGAFVFPYYLLALFAVMIAATWLLGTRLKKQGRYSG